MKMMPIETIDKLIEVLRYFAEMTTSPAWIIQYIAEIEEELIKDSKRTRNSICICCGNWMSIIERSKGVCTSCGKVLKDV